jgi:hypothetical protein
MSGVKWLYISEDAKVYALPNPKQNDFKPVPELANKNVLMISVGYETHNKRPYRLISIQFDRVSLDHSGKFILTDEIVQSKLRNFLEFGSETAESLSIREEPLPIPDAPILPNEKEIEALKEYLKINYPALFEYCDYMIAIEIERQDVIYHKNLMILKEAAKIRNRSNKQ